MISLLFFCREERRCRKKVSDLPGLAARLSLDNRLTPFSYRTKAADVSELVPIPLLRRSGNLAFIDNFAARFQSFSSDPKVAFAGIDSSVQSS